MTYNRFIGHITVMLTALLTASMALADTSPIGTLKALGKVTVEAPASTFTLTDQEYAYFSGDMVATAEDSHAVIGLNEGLDVTFVGAAEGTITRAGAGYDIDVGRGHILVEAGPGVDYRITHKGEPVSLDQSLDASDEPFVVSVAESGDVQFYKPAQLDDDDRAAGALRGSLERAGLTADHIAMIVAALAGAVIVVSDDDDPSS